MSISLPTRRIIAQLENAAQKRGYPAKIRMDNDPENISKIMKGWAEYRNIQLEFIEPGKPAQNGYIKRFNRTYREEILDMYLFKSIQHAQAITDAWIEEYNTQRPHHALNNLTPHQHLLNHQNSTSTLY